MHSTLPKALELRVGEERSLEEMLGPLEKGCMRLRAQAKSPSSWPSKFTLHSHQNVFIPPLKEATVPSHSVPEAGTTRPENLDSCFVLFFWSAG